MDGLPVHVFLLCYNEAPLLPHAVRHYKKYLPTCKITIYDNYSTDTSREIAAGLGCDIMVWGSDNILDDRIQVMLKNSVWKTVSSGWIIVADMDEFLCVTEDDLRSEHARGTTLLRTRGLDMIGESETLDLTDIDLQGVRKYVRNTQEDKTVCFRREAVVEMHYTLGAHLCDPHGMRVWSDTVYDLKHMSYLGLPFILNKIMKRYERTELMRTMGIAIHYTNDPDAIRRDFESRLQQSELLDA